MRKVIIILLFFASITASAQSVLGIPFGSSYDGVKHMLEERIGEYKVIEDGGSLKVYGISIGGFEFKFGEFNFQYAGNLSYFNAASFQTYYSRNNVDVAKRDRDYLFSLLKNKYKDEYLEEYINEQGFKCYRFGTNPKDEYSSLGAIVLQRGKGNDGISRLYLHLVYFPIHYIDESYDF